MVVVVILDRIFVLMNTTTMIPLQVRLTCIFKLILISGISLSGKNVSVVAN